MHITRLEVAPSSYSPGDGLHTGLVRAFTRHTVLPLLCKAMMSQSALEQDVRAALVCDAIRQLQHICSHQGCPGPVIEPGTLREAA